MTTEPTLVQGGLFHGNFLRVRYWGIANFRGSMVKGKKRCYRGKSCSSTCIAKGYLCIVELGPELAKMLRDVRGRWGATGGMDRWDKSFDHSKRAKRIEKLYEVYKKLPEGPQKERVKQRIQHIENTRLGKKARHREITRVMDPHDPERYMRELYDKEGLAREAAAERKRVREKEKELDGSDSWYQRDLNRYRRPGRG